jgi:hypothetical protein
MNAVMEAQDQVTLYYREGSSDKGVLAIGLVPDRDDADAPFCGHDTGNSPYLTVLPFGVS